MNKKKFREENLKNEYIIGRNSVLEALKSGRIIDSIMISSKDSGGSLRVILSLAAKKNITIKEVSRLALDSISSGLVHQGVIAAVGAKEYSSIDDILNLAKNRNEHPFIIVAEGIEDPHNLGAIIRSAECAGAHGVIIPKRRAVGLTMTVEKSSAGALEHLLVSKVNNISASLELLKKRGLWIYGADMSGDMWTSQDLTGPIAIVIGSEGKGISINTRKKCDFILSIPMKGKINSLNASVAAGVMMYEVCRQRMKKC